MNRFDSRTFRRALLTASIGLMLFSLAGLVWLNLRLSGKSFWGGSSPLPVLTQLPDFQLTERSGQPLGLSNLRGKVWIADFVFTRCPGPCPRMTASMADMQQGLAGEKDLRLVSISVDPEFDTPQVLAQYAVRFHAVQDRWFFLTGDKPEVHQLAKAGFLVGSLDDVMMHTTRFILVDRLGRVRGYYDSNDEESLRKLVNDAKRLSREKEV